MELSTERQIEGVLIDVSVVPWAVLMRADDSALGEALKGRRLAIAAGEAGSGPAEAASVFANYVSPG